MRTLSALCLLLAVAVAIEKPEEDDKAVRVTIESCDIPQISEAIFKSVPGAPPEAVFFNKDDKELSRVSLSEKSREECLQLLAEHGFHKKSEEKRHEL
ncbi:Hypothetical predicted protein [Cloeon dipterum]|uniref:Selenoprotein F/M domain-containing protein n=1 Tax=Cloeon dipterum TaxID=197152 RepID=A0A8S1D4W6_9INSE|nr:Hypothetical predicted protein [Cloeon dipterum]